MVLSRGFKKTPRVILSIRHFYPDGGGAEVSALNLAQGLVRRGLALTVLTGRYGGRPRLENVEGLVIRRHFIGAYVPVLHELCYLASLALELIIRRHEYDIVHVFQTQLSACVSLMVAKCMGKRVITSGRGAGKSGDMAVWSSIPVGRRLLRYVAGHVDAAVGVSRDVVTEFLQAGFDPVRTAYFPNGIPLPPLVQDDRSRLREKLGLPPEDFIAAFVGRLSHEKNPELLLSAWSRVAARHPAGKLLFVGEGEMRRALEASARAAGLWGSVVFTGRVENVGDYLNAVDAFVLPSLTEGMSVALLEAMAARLPVVASRVSGTVDIIRDGVNGLLFESGDEQELVKCILSLRESPERRGDLGRRARQTVEESFSLDAAVDRYIGLYKSLMADGNAGNGGMMG